MQTHDEKNNHTHEQQARITRSCMDFVQLKEGLDALGKNQQFASPLERIARKLSCLTPHNGEEWTAMQPWDFCRYALPFSDPAGAHDPSMAPEDINPRLVIAGTYNNYTPSTWRGDIDPTHVMAWSDGLVGGGDLHHAELPRLAKIGSLPLYVANEGKNRVSLFKQYRRSMKAMVMKTAFPQPQDLQLVRLWPFGIHALKHGTSTEVLPFPAYTVPLLKAYGVPIGEGFMDIPAVVRFCGKRKRICSQQMWR